MVISAAGGGLAVIQALRTHGEDVDVCCKACESIGLLAHDALVAPHLTSLGAVKVLSQVSSPTCESCLLSIYESCVLSMSHVSYL